MIRAYKFLLRPTVRQAQSLAEMLADHCSLYNGALQERRDAWRHTSKTTVRYGDQSAQLKEIRAFDPERHGRWSFSSQQATLRRLDRAMQAFFRRVKAGKTPGYPRFKGIGHFDTVAFPKDGDGCRWDSTPRDRTRRAYLLGIGHIRVHQHRSVQGRVKTISVKREGKRWFLVLVCDQVPAKLLPQTGAVVGIDMGIAHFLTTSDGEHVPNPRHGRNAVDRLTKAQRSLATFPRRKAKNRTSRHHRAVERVARLHQKVRRQRLDYAHKTALALVRDHDVIVHEDLRISNMTKAPARKPDLDQPGVFLPNGSAAKASLNRSITDAGWGVFFAILANKAESAGRTVIAVNPRNTSRRCAECGHVSGESRPTQETFCCVSCGHASHADANAAVNVLRAGLALYQAMKVA